jgi:hypothetical protein
MKIKEITDIRVVGAFMGALCFTNGVCPFCKDQVSKKTETKNTINLEVCKKHLEEKHSLKELKDKSFFWKTVKEII